jgi:N-acetylglucosamine-6-phosphate deacetylase
MDHRTILFRNADIYTPEGRIESGTLAVSRGKIAGIHRAGETADYGSEAEVVDASGLKLVPGFFDVHVHGGAGGEFSSGKIETFGDICRYHAAHGTTTMLATTLTDTRERLERAVQAITEWMDRPEPEGARVWGIHLEGPFLNKVRTGAQNPEFLRDPDLDELRMYAEHSGGRVRLITIAPEMPGAEEMIRWAAEHGITVSIGHSDATHEQMLAAIAWGARHVTHLFNGMRPLHHREPGVAGTALIRDELTVELICDGIHVHRDLIPWVMRTKPEDKVVCVTDCMAAAGMPPGDYMLGSLPVRMIDGQVRLITADGSPGSLAGSSLNMHQALLNCLAFTGWELEKLLPYFTLNPARQAGAAHVKGSIEIGKDADLVLLDDRLQIRGTYVEGVRV